MDSKIKYRKSRQRDTIQEMLMNRKDHPTADTLFFELKKEFPDLSLGNVYRNLNILVEQGVIQRLDLGSTFNRFDGNAAPHSHFICTICNSVSDVDLKFDLDVSIVSNESLAGHISGYKLDFFGVCEKCRR